MAIIVQMPAPRARSIDAAAIESGATILFFTGVRYVRDDEYDTDVADESLPADVLVVTDESTAAAAV